LPFAPYRFAQSCRFSENCPEDGLLGLFSSLLAAVTSTNRPAVPVYPDATIQYNSMITEGTNQSFPMFLISSTHQISIHVHPVRHSWQTKRQPEDASHENSSQE
jgi:hypothetical protein